MRYIKYGDLIITYPKPYSTYLKGDCSHWAYGFRGSRLAGSQNSWNFKHVPKQQGPLTWTLSLCNSTHFLKAEHAQWNPWNFRSPLSAQNFQCYCIVPYKSTEIASRTGIAFGPNDVHLRYEGYEGISNI